MSQRLRILLASLSLFVVCNAAVAGEAVDLFERHVRPLFVDRCQKCHGDAKQWGSLRLDSRQGVLDGGDSGPAVVPGNAAVGELAARLASHDDAVRMPPPEEGPPVSPDVVDAVRAWIAAGAVWPAGDAPVASPMAAARETHWAYQPISAPVPPSVADESWIRGPIDRFVLAALEAAGLRPAAEADRATYIRRATYDLLGLPPTADEIKAFESDASSQAYETLIDRLLASPRYGEHWGRHWLDAARYADTKGYTDVGETRWHVHAAPYRDWVIRAFNEDMPYDRFLRLQLAADQAAPHEPEHLAAMGFLTLGRRFLGNTPDIIDDRIDVVTRGMLGLTVACARCHDHKYDPIPTRDYYSLYGVFQNCVDRLVPLPRRSGAPSVREDFAQGLADRQRDYDALVTQKRGEANARLRKRFADYLLAQRDLATYPEQEFVQLSKEDDILPGIVRRFEVFLRHAERVADPVFLPWIRYAALSDGEFPSRASEVTDSLRAGPQTVNPLVAAAFADPPVSMADVAARYAALLAASDARWTEAVSAAGRDGLPEPACLANVAEEEVRQAFSGEGSPCVIPDEPLVQTDYLWDFDTRQALWKARSAIDAWLHAENPDAAPYAVILEDRRTLIDPLVFRGGRAAAKGDAVPRQFLEVLADSERRPFARGSGRLELAEAIADPTNPLTPRVWVNRVWLHHFGAGLVTTPSDFGVRAAAPSHPELLDWLATRLRADGWRTKPLHREIMLSATYRQSSRADSDDAVSGRADTIDPSNRLLSRMNPRRLSFEQLRDTLLAASGDLDLATGGRGDGVFGTRRSVYVTVERQALPAVFGVFDVANPDLHSPQRPETTTALQALFTLNHPFVADRARRAVVRHAADPRSEAEIEELYRGILGRSPSDSERQDAARFVAAAIVEPTGEPPGETVLAPLEQLAQVLLLSNEFMFVD